MYDVGAVGLNLHHSCNWVQIVSFARSFALKEQLCGRTLEETALKVYIREIPISTLVTPRFPLTVVRCWTPNSHDQFRGSLQADKANVQLAANAHGPGIRKLIISLLDARKPEVNQLRNSSEGQRLLQEVAAYSAIKKENGKSAALYSEFSLLHTYT
ncbi:unnamed protein product [Aureobasidium mustum]|uniref:Uncharacterized protein n=1 Tax=Aureobasidium mustum TaxID=2773714 RepID=A0A9N8K5T9_9PEZI|nr:unnamed protein product [Aureobasidium mustum]